VKIVPLDENNIGHAVKLANSIFISDVPTPEECFKASLYPKSFKLLWVHYRLTYLKYWVLYHPNSVFDILGTVGIYSLEQDDIIADWVGYLCVDVLMRRRGFATDLMNFIMPEMQKRGKKRVKLYVDEIAVAAQRLYKNLGFYQIGKGEDPGGSKILYFEKAL
jgi:ribosomal protein S18 acetylase RimI-like enzyme